MSSGERLIDLKPESQEEVIIHESEMEAALKVLRVYRNRLIHPTSTAVEYSQVPAFSQVYVYLYQQALAHNKIVKEKASAKVDSAEASKQEAEVQGI